MNKNKKGYVLIQMPAHPRADSSGRVFEHIVVWETTHNAKVPRGCVIHHINGIKDDNRPENLQLLTASEHTILHNSLRKLSDETKYKISEKAKESYRLGRKPPMYKDVNMSLVLIDICNGLKMQEICKKYSLGRATLYKKLRREGYYESRIVNR